MSEPARPSAKRPCGQDNRFAAQGLERAGWTNAGPIRAIFRKAFEAAGLPYANPHSFRHAIAQHVQSICRTPEELKAMSQNLGHSSVTTTLAHYCEIPSKRQGELIRNLGRSVSPDEKAVALAKQMLKLVEDRK